MAVPGSWRRAKPDDTALITDAHPSLADERAYRAWRYAITMTIRLVCLLLAVLLRGTPWVWGAIVGAVVLPWAAVLMANERLPRGHRRVAWHDGEVSNEFALGATSRPDGYVIEHGADDLDRDRPSGHHKGL